MRGEVGKSFPRPIPLIRTLLLQLGKTGIALEDFAESGMVRIHSELWRATTDRDLHKGQKVLVKGLDGLTLLVTPYNNQEKD